MSTETLANPTYLPEAPSEVAQNLELRHPVGNLHDLYEIADALIGVPMITKHDLTGATGGSWVVESYGSGALEVDDVSVPLSRIVGIESFATWAGREFQVDGTVEKEHDSGSSLASIAAMARGEVNFDGSYQRERAPLLQVFEDADGEVYCLVTTDGSHRTAAAKLAGKETLDHAFVAVGTQRMKVKFSVAARLRAQKQATETPVGEQSRAAYVKQYVAMSKELDDRVAAEQRAHRKAEVNYLAGMLAGMALGRLAQPEDDPWD